MEIHYINNIIGRSFFKGTRLMFAVEAGFGHISEPVNCWAPPKQRPAVPSQRVRQYKTVYGAVCPEDGEFLYEVMEGSNTDNMRHFLKKLSEQFSDEMILLCLDRASWHTTKMFLCHTTSDFFSYLPVHPK